MIKRNYILWIGAGLVVLWIFFYSFSSSENDPNYANRILQERRDKDRSMLEDSDSPFEGQEFNGLKYYPVDSKFRVQARIEQIEKPDRIFLETNDGDFRQYERFAFAHFTIDQQQNKLVLLRPYPIQNLDQFFLPFGDETSAIDTYGAGRYLDLKFKPGSSRVEIDFNLAYSPFCAYNPTFSCPLPAKENLLKIAIEAGEKNYD